MGIPEKSPVLSGYETSVDKGNIGEVQIHLYLTEVFKYARECIIAASVPRIKKADLIVLVPVSGFSELAELANFDEKEQGPVLTDRQLSLNSFCFRSPDIIKSYCYGLYLRVRAARGRLLVNRKDCFQAAIDTLERARPFFEGVKAKE